MTSTHAGRTKVKQENKMATKKQTKAMTPAETLRLAGGKFPFGVGEAIFIRTVTHYHVGRVAAILPGFIVLMEASWVADTDRFSDTLSKGTLRESEKCPSWVMVSLDAIVDVFPWRNELPTKNIMSG
jgi:hypothetical protein